jgi:hypothetical protein
MNSRLIGKYRVEVKLVKFEQAREVANGLLVELLPAHFEEQDCLTQSIML